MSQRQEQRTSSSPYIDKVWHSVALTDGSYLATPDGSWDLIYVTKADGTRMVYITGQASRPSRLAYKAGEQSVVIQFAAGAYLVPFQGAPFTDNYIMLNMPDQEHFELAGQIFPLPTFDAAEELISQMADQQLLASDAMVESVLRGAPKAASKRSIERHFKTTTGLSPKKLANIRRAQQAVRLLKNGVDPSTTAAEAGYYDQPHLTKELKRLMDSRPSNVDDINQV